jgi:hypothetical protein
MTERDKPDRLAVDPTYRGSIAAGSSTILCRASAIANGHLALQMKSDASLDVLVKELEAVRDVRVVAQIVAEPLLVHKVHLAIEYEAGDGKRQAGAHPALGGIFIAFVGIIPAIRTAVDIFEAR